MLHPKWSSSVLVRPLIAAPVACSSFNACAVFTAFPLSPSDTLMRRLLPAMFNLGRITSHQGCVNFHEHIMYSFAYCVRPTMVLTGYSQV